MSSGRVASETREYQDILLAEVLERAEAEGEESFVSAAFTDLVLDDLEEEGRWPDYQQCLVDQRGLRVDAWGIDQAQRALYLAITDFDRSSSTVTLPKGEIDRFFGRLTTFLEKARAGKLQVEDHLPGADLVDAVQANQYERVYLYLLSHRVAKDESLADDTVDSLKVSKRVWDLEMVRRSRQSTVRVEPISIDFAGEGRAPLPFLDGGARAGVQIYLLFVPASTLAEIYIEHGGRILERNVRAFLSVRGKVNQGIRDTLRDKPERFLAYNNGLTATAANIEIVQGVDGRSRIAHLDDLQIVNGGQTTASIAAAFRDPKVDLTNVFVQMKLAVIEPELLEEMVPNISKYANRQNTVQESDLSSNNEYLVGLQAASRSTWTPAAATGRPTKWYFERARGGYNVDQTSSGPLSAQKRFLQDYPKNQKFGKNELALYENTWSQLPHIVCRGGQKNFREFLLEVEDPTNLGPEADLAGWYRTRFRDLVSKAIVFKAADSAVRSAYGGTYKRAVVTYTLGYLLAHVDTPPSLDLIWRNQAIGQAFHDAIVEVAGPLKDALIDSAAGQNITEWAKKPACWQTLQAEFFRFAPFVGEAAEAAKHSAAFATTLHGGKSLSDAIEEVHGAPIEGLSKRYRKKRWHHLGDTGIPGSHSGTLHAYSAAFTSGGVESVFTVVVDFNDYKILPLGDLDSVRHDLVNHWLVEKGVSYDGG